MKQSHEIAPLLLNHCHQTNTIVYCYPYLPVDMTKRQKLVMLNKPTGALTLQQQPGGTQNVAFTHVKRPCNQQLNLRSAVYCALVMTSLRPCSPLCFRDNYALLCAWRSSLMACLMFSPEHVPHYRRAGTAFRTTRTCNRASSPP